MKQNFNGCIPTTEIQSIEMKEIDTDLTIFSIIIFIGAVVALAVAATSFDFSGFSLGN